MLREAGDVQFVHDLSDEGLPQRSIALSDGLELDLEPERLLRLRQQLLAQQRVGGGTASVLRRSPRRGFLVSATEHHAGGRNLASGHQRPCCDADAPGRLARCRSPPSHRSPSASPEGVNPSVTAGLLSTAPHRAKSCKGAARTFFPAFSDKSWNLAKNSPEICTKTGGMGPVATLLA